MNLEQLTKTQIILLTLLVSFVTSIATGIVTVTLVEQAPPALTQTVNRIVERTVERVVPSESQGANVITREKEVTVVVKEDDLITTSIERNAKSLVRISRAPEFVEAGGDPFVGVGIMVSRDGLVATDEGIIDGSISYTITLPDGTTAGAKAVANRGGSVALLRIEVGEGDPDTFAPVALGALGSLKLGQTVIVLSGRERVNVSTGIIKGLIEGKKEKGAESVISRIDTSLTGAPLPGSPLVNIFGDVVGLSTLASREWGASSYAPVSVILSELQNNSTQSAPSTEKPAS